MKKISSSVLIVVSLLLSLYSLPTLAADNRNDLNTHLAQLGAYLAEALGFGGPCGDNDSKSSPVLAGNREFVWDVTDVALSGRPALHLTRYYRSFDTREGIFGKGWSTHCEKVLVRVIDYEAVGDSANAEPVVKYLYRSQNGKRYEYVEASDGSFTAPDGMKTRKLSVSSDGQPSLTYLDGRSETFNVQGQLIAETDRNGNVVSYEYLNGALSKMADANGRFLAFTYDSSGHVTTVADHTNRAWRYVYNQDGSLESVTDPLGNATHYEYQTIQREASAEIYPAISEIIDESGVTTIAVSYDDIGRVETYTVGENVFTYSLDSRGYLYKTDGVGSRWAHKTNENGLITEFYPPINSRIPEGKVFDDNGNITQYTDLAGTELTFTYDALGRITSSTTPDGTSTVSYQGDRSWVAEISSVTGRSVSFTYDAKGNPKSITDPIGNVSQYTWNSQGDLIGASDPLGSSVSQTFNDSGLVTSATDPLGQVTQYEYDKLGRLISITDPAGASSTFTYDQLDRLVSASDALGQTVQYRYDAASRLLSVTSPSGGVTAYQYDEHGRLSSETRPDGGQFSFAYGVDNLLLSSTDPRGVVTSYTYDAGKRLTRVTAGNRSSYSYRYDVLGRMTQASSGVSTVSFTYDSSHRVLTETQDRRDTTFEYNSEGELITLSYNNEDLGYTYDDRGFLTAFTTPSGTHTYSHDAAGRLTQHTLPNGSSESMSYDAKSQLLNQDQSSITGEQLGYAYDSLGRLTQVSGKGVNDWTYQYDAISRLTSGSQDSNYVYQYDSMGNRLENGGVYDSFNKLLEDNNNTYTYDELGSLVSKVSKLTGEETRYSYDGFARLTSVAMAPAVDATASSTTSYSYDALGRRVIKEVDRTRTYYRWQGTDLIAEYESTSVSSSPMASYRYDGAYTAVEFTDENGTYDVVADYLGTASRLVDQSSTVVWRNNNGPYSEVDESAQVENSVEFNQRFPGQYFDKETGLHYNNNRYYDPTIGRYLRSDPIGIAGGLNEYLYAGASPTNWIDPSGEAIPIIVYGFYAISAGLTVSDTYNVMTNDCLSGGQKIIGLVTGPVIGKIGRFWKVGKNVAKGAGKASDKATDFVVSPGGTAFPVPKGATGPTAVVNPGGKTTGSAFTGGKGGANGKVDAMRIMDPTPPRGKSPGYPNGYIKYENKSGQGVDPYTGRTLSNKDSHFPID